MFMSWLLLHKQEVLCDQKQENYPFEHDYEREMLWRRFVLLRVLISRIRLS